MVYLMSKKKKVNYMQVYILAWRKEDTRDNIRKYVFTASLKSMRDSDN